MVASRFKIYLVRLKPTEGREIRKTRPCLIIAPDEMFRQIAKVTVTPMTAKGCSYPTPIPARFLRRTGEIVQDQIHTVDKNQLIKYLGKIKEATNRSR